MRQPYFVLSPCGISLLTNVSTTQHERMAVNHNANAKDRKKVNDENLQVLDVLINQAIDRMTGADPLSAARLSAEVNGIVKLYNCQFNKAHQDHHLLLCTDTWLGETSAQIVSEWLKQQGIKIVEVKRQTDLQTEDIISFQYALSEIVSWCAETLPTYRNNAYHIIFNLTGGFKSIQGFLQTLAMFYADESVYVFETASDLLRIPRLPVKIIGEETVHQHIKTFRRLSMGLSVLQLDDIPETLLMEMGGEKTLSTWGELVWAQTKKQIYEEQLWPSPSPRLSFSHNFERSVRELSKDRLVLINERIDQLAKCLETNGGYNPSSLDLKPLKGNPCPPSTHEIDAWADQDAKRMYGHYDSGNFILDKLGNALH
ncbi:MAG: putative CRISPR-associated protein [Chloroflexota bacterium]